MANHKKLLTLYSIITTIIILILLPKASIAQLLSSKISTGKEHPVLTPFQVEMQAHLKRVDKNTTSGSVIFLGDSITQGMSVSDISNKSVNFGLGGDTSKNLLSRVASMESIKEADKIIIEIGVNDIQQGLINTVKNVERILNLIDSSVPVFLLAILPVDESKTKKINRTIATTNKEYKAICEKKENCTFIENYQRLMNSNRQLKKQYHSGDGVHLNESGYSTLKSILSQVISK
ncbi:SGNH/GDSL hydrolase family protein [Neptunomonas japonica]|uniref:SGNH/GDSL hydrolase family protein n=1 Tax=Neptunomonas japonica TaxID=417574 RepID=UPI000418D175|nr:GDSL-type esterase/lipase family protein [Neptunomonas japonica]